MHRMAADNDDRSVDQELADGTSEATPVIALTTVIAAVAVLVVVALALAAFAYLLA